MHYIIKTVISLFLLLLMGCGETSNLRETSVDETLLSLELEKSDVRNNKLNINFLVKNKYAKGVTVHLSDFTLDVASCKIDSILFTPNKMTLTDKIKEKNLNVELAFKEPCAIKNYSVKAKTILSLDGKKNELIFQSTRNDLNLTNVASATDTNDSSFDSSLDDNSSLPIYTFFNTPKYLKIDKENSEYNFKVQLLDSERKVVSGEKIYISAYDTSFGELKSYSSMTDDNGFAHFSFTSPNSLDTVAGKSLTLSIHNDTGFSKLTASIEVQFEELSNVDINYEIVNTNNLLVSLPSHAYQLTAYLVDNRGVAVAGKKIEVTTLNRRFGTLDAFSKTTDERSGKVSFLYTSPKDIKSIDGESINLTFIFMEDNVKLTKTINLKFMAGEEDTTLPIIVIPDELESITLNNNSQTVDIPIKVFKDIVPYTKGFVNVQLPKNVLEGVDVGSFSSFSVPVDENGIALLHYTGPSNLKALVNNGNLSSTFKIYHSENMNEKNRKSFVVNYDVSSDEYVSVNYMIDVSTENSDFSMGIPNVEKSFSVVLKDLSNNVILDKDINITSLRVTTENSLLVQIFDGNQSKLVDSLSLETKNNSLFILKSKTLSGLVPIKVTMEFKDINGINRTLDKMVNIQIFSGPPSAVSISYLSTEQDVSRAKYEDNFVVSVTDDYGNRVNSKPYIALGAIVGYAVDGKEATSKESNESKRLFYGKSDIDKGVANGIIDIVDNSTIFKDDTLSRANVFNYVNREGENSDKLILFGRGKNYEAMGKWDFNRENNSTLNLEDDYFGTKREKLYYAVGHNYYQDQCKNDGREWLGSTDSETYQLDSEGSVVISYKYDYHLMGKDAMIWVNLSGYQPDTKQYTRIGEAIKHTLRGKGLRSNPTAGYSLDKNEIASATFEIWHKESVYPYRNAHFGYSIAEGSNCQIISRRSSNDYDARTCDNGYSREGRGYVTFILKSPEDKSCTFNIEDILVSNEF